MLRKLLNYLLKAQIKKKVSETLKLEPESFKLGFPLGGYSLKGTYKSVDEIKSKKEVLEDIFSTKIYQIKRRERFLRADDIVLIISSLKKKNYDLKAAKRSLSGTIGRWLEDESCLEVSFFNKPGMLIAGGAGSGKTNQGNIIGYSFLLKNKDYKSLIIDPKASEFLPLHNAFRERSEYYQPKSLEDFKAIAARLKEIEKEIKSLEQDLRLRKVAISNWHKLESRPKYFILVDESSEVIPRKTVGKLSSDDEKQLLETQREISGYLKRFLKLYRYTSSVFIVFLNQDSKVDAFDVNLENIATKIYYHQPTNAQSINLVGNLLLRNESLRNGRGVLVHDGELREFQADFFPLDELAKRHEQKRKHFGETVEKIRNKAKANTLRRMNKFNEGFLSAESKNKYRFFKLKEDEVARIGGRELTYYQKVREELFLDELTKMSLQGRISLQDLCKAGGFKDE